MLGLLVLCAVFKKSVSGPPFPVVVVRQSVFRYAVVRLSVSRFVVRCSAVRFSPFPVAVNRCLFPVVDLVASDSTAFQCWR